MLDVYHLVNHDKEIVFLEECKDDRTGGYAKYPEHHPGNLMCILCPIDIDLMHTQMSLTALEMMKASQSQDNDGNRVFPALDLPWTAYKHLLDIQKRWDNAVMKI